MKTIALLGLAVVAGANPLPQSIDIAAIHAIPVASPKSAPFGANAEKVAYNSEAIAEATYDDVFKNHTPAKRALKARTEPGPCGANPVGSGPTPDPDTAESFLLYDGFITTANDAEAPTGYSTAFQTLDGATSLSMGYLGVDPLTSYDTEFCANKCNSISECVAFNIYFERAPLQVPAPACPNPASTTIIKCSYWGAPVSAETATNRGQRRDDFEIVIAGSNGYNAQKVKNVPSYTGDYLGDKAINAPSECNTYITQKTFDDGMPFDPKRCAAACQAETDYNVQHLNSRAICRFFNTYVLLKNGAPLGQHCALYTASWDGSYATNSGQTDGSDVYTIAYSYSYSNTSDPKPNDCTCGIDSKCNTGDLPTSSTSSSAAASTTSSAAVSISSSILSTTSSSADSTSSSVVGTSSLSDHATSPSAASTISSSASSPNSSKTETTTQVTTSFLRTTGAVSSTTTKSYSIITTAKTTSASTTAKSPSTTAKTTSASTTAKVSSTTLKTTTKTSTTTSSTPTPEGPCFRVKVSGPSYCNNAYVTLDSAGALTYSASSASTFYLDDSSNIRTKDGKYGKSPNAKTSQKYGSITFDAATDPDSVTCSTSGSDVTCIVQGTTIKDLWTNSSKSGIVLGSQPASSNGVKWDKISTKIETCSCSA